MQVSQRLDEIPTKMDEHNKGIEAVTKDVKNLSVQMEEATNKLESSTKACTTTLETAIKTTETNNSYRHKGIVDQQATIYRDIQTIQQVCQAVDHKTAQVGTTTTEIPLVNNQDIIDPISQLSTTITQNLTDIIEKLNEHDKASIEFRKIVSLYIGHLHKLAESNAEKLAKVSEGMKGLNKELDEELETTKGQLIEETRINLETPKQDLNIPKEGASE